MASNTASLMTGFQLSSFDTTSVSDVSGSSLTDGKTDAGCVTGFTHPKTKTEIKTEQIKIEPFLLILILPVKLLFRNFPCIVVSFTGNIVLLVIHIIVLHLNRIFFVVPKRYRKHQTADHQN